MSAMSSLRMNQFIVTLWSKQFDIHSGDGLGGGGGGDGGALKCTRDITTEPQILCNALQHAAAFCCSFETSMNTSVVVLGRKVTPERLLLSFGGKEVPLELKPSGWMVLWKDGSNDVDTFWSSWWKYMIKCYKLFLWPTISLWKPVFLKEQQINQLTYPDGVMNRNCCIVNGQREDYDRSY